MERNVLMPLSLLARIAELLGYWDVSAYDQAIRDERDDVLLAIDTKMSKLELRAAYARMVAADGDGSRHAALTEYLWQKNLLKRMAGESRAV